MRWSLSVAVLTVGLVTAAGPARADVDVEVPVPAKLQGSLAAGEMETVRFFAPAQSTLTAKLGTKKKAGLDVALRLLDPTGAEQPLTAGKLKDKGASIKVSKVPLDQSGTWTLQVSADGAGDYKLAVKVKVPTRLSEDLELGVGDAEMLLPVQYGATVKITAKALKGDAVTPVLQSLDGEDLSAEGKRTSTSHKATVAAGASGDLALRISAEGDGGTARVTVKLKPPKSKAAKVDVRAASLGRPAGGETAVGRVLAPDEGGTVAASESSDLFGAAVDVPAGALSEPTLISIRSADAETLPDDTDTNAGPTVEFGPPGLEFSEPVTVTVPIDAQALPVQADEGDITVLVVEDDGSSQVLVPTSVDLDAGVCTVPVSGFSRFTAVAPAGSPQLAGRSYWGFAFDANLEVDGSGRDESGVRRAFRADVRMEFDADGTSYTVDLDEREVSFGVQRGQNEALEPVDDVAAGASQDSGTWQYGLGGRRVRLFSQSEPGEDRLFVSRDGTILLNTTDEPEEGTPEDALLDVLVERPVVSDPSALVVGAYHFGELAFLVEPSSGGGLLGLEFLSTIGTVTFKADGTLSVDATHSEAFGGDGPQPGVFTFGQTRDRGNASWSVDSSGPYAGSILLDDQEGPGFRFFPHRDGRMLVGSRRDGPEEDWAFIVAVKVSSGRSVADLDGNHAVGTAFFQLDEYQIENGQPGSGQFLFVPDFGLSSESSRLLFDGAGSVTLSPRSALFQERDPFTSGGVLIDTQIGGDVPFGYTLAKDGKFRFLVEGNELPGGVTPDGSFGFAIQDPDDPTFGLILFVDRPPQQP